MSAPRLLRLVPGLAACVCAYAVAGCGAEEVGVSTPPKVDPSTAEAVLRSYLDDDRCDLLSDKLAESIAPDADSGRALCARGQLPVDAYVRPAQYKVTQAEVIDGDGLFTIELRDGGTRDYTLVPGGPAGFQVDSMVPHTEAELGEPLRVQARATAGGPLVDAQVTVRSLERIPDRDLSADEYVTSLNAYYRASVRIKSLADDTISVGSLGFTIAQKNGVDVAQAVAPFSEIGPLLPTTVAPGDVISGYLFFAVPSVKVARPSMVRYTIGTGPTGARLVWKKP